MKNILDFLSRVMLAANQTVMFSVNVLWEQGAGWVKTMCQYASRAKNIRPSSVIRVIRFCSSIIWPAHNARRGVHEA